MRMHRILASLLLVLPATAGVTQEVALDFRPQVGSANRKTWTTTHKLRVQSIFTRVGEERFPGQLDLSVATERKLVSIDHYRALREGNLPADLRRTFETLERVVQVRNEDDTARPLTQPSSLAGTSVVYEWVPGKGEYGRHFDALEGEEYDLLGLREDLDLRSLLPADGTAEVGETWSVPAGELGDVLAPGGAMRMTPVRGLDPLTQRSIEGGVGGSLYRAFEGGPSRGGLEVTLVGLEEGGRLARLALVADLRVSSDQTEYVRGNAGPGERRAGIRYDGADLVFELTARGNCLWDLEAHRAHSMELVGRQTTTYRILSHDENSADKVQSEQYLQMGGSFELALRVEPAEPPPVPGPAAAGR